MKRNIARILTCVMVISILMVPVCVMAGEKINLNTATLEELTTLKGIGPSLAQRVVDYRKNSGSFGKTEDLMKVKGIGQKIFDANKDIITVK